MAYYKMTEQIKKKISQNRKGKGIGNKNGKGKNLGNKSAKGKVSGKNNGNWKGGISNKELVAGRKKPEQCEICGSIGNICFDHDHSTGLFRGWICRRCNLTLGLVKDNQELLFNLAKYLENVSNNNRHKTNSITKKED